MSRDIRDLSRSLSKAGCPANPDDENEDARLKFHGDLDILKPSMHACLKRLLTKLVADQHSVHHVADYCLDCAKHQRGGKVLAASSEDVLICQ